ncbi:hypothetical protein D6D23_05040 [Aureobasidium pullulans]|nr:hypothetical protein D6D23_05040 [Aureobasidium pullulans]
MASLPPGMYGAVSSAVTARNMIWSFPAIRFCLLVGIGGGIPSESNDIRLGDVVVSSPSGTYGGVVQIDVGKRHSDTSFERTGYLNSPPMALLHAVQRLKTRDILIGLDLNQDIAQVLEGYPRMRKQYRSPGRHQDLLFRADYSHAQSGENCSSCDHSNLMARSDRYNQDPVVHHGLIASGNSLVKDAYYRDQIGTELGAICFEMEAAGLMNTLPCLVIRGVADYADTHKNAAWQGYAALAASAYTKQLLSVISVTSNQSIAAAASFDPDLSNAYHLDAWIDDAASMSSDTLVGTSVAGDADVRISAVRKVAQVLLSDERLRPVCVIAALRLKRYMLQWNISAALKILSNSLRKQPRTPVILGLRWLFNRYRSHIATIMTEIVCDQEGLLGVGQVDTSPVSDEILARSLKNRFPAANVANAAANRTRSEEVPTMDLEEIDVEVQEPHNEAILKNLTQLDEILCRGVGFEDMLSKLRELLIPPVHILIENTLGTYLAETEGIVEIICLVEWELLELVNIEGLGVEDMDCLFTLSGDFDHAHASPLAGHEIWATGMELLEAVKACMAMASNNVFDPVHTEHEAGVDSTHRTKMQLFPAKMNDEKEYAVVHIAGSATYIKAVVPQLAWLTATLRVPHEETLTVSCINFQPHRTQSGEIMDGVFRMSLWEREKVPQPNNEPGKCWTQLFAQSVLAYGFLSSKRGRPDSMRGLEIPFDIITSFAGIRFPLLLGERLAFASERHVLIPEIFSDDSIQWHFEIIENALRQTTTTYKVPAPGMESVDFAKVCEYRAFLGYSRRSEVVMGTAEFCDMNITASRIPRRGYHLDLKNEGPLSAGPSLKGYFTATLGTTWRFKRGEMAQIEGSTVSLNDLLKRSAETPALLYNDHSCTAFLLSELSIVVQMAASYLQTHSKLVAAQVPRAARSSDGGKAAYEAVKAAKDLEVRFEIGKPKKYSEIVREFLDQLEQRKKQRRSNQSFSEISFKKGLRGWSYTDVQEKRFEFWEREFPTDLLHSRPIWWQLFRDLNLTILFGGDMPQPIRICRDQVSSSCTSWDELPTGHHLLLAQVQDLNRLTRDLGDASSKYPARFMLTADLAWARPANSRLLDTDCKLNGRCNPMQTMREPRKLWLEEKRARYWRHPGQLEPEGLVLFADDPSVIKDRPCQLVKPHQNAAEFQLRFVVGAILFPLFALMFCRFLVSY